MKKLHYVLGLVWLLLACGSQGAWAQTDEGLGPDGRWRRGKRGFLLRKFVPIDSANAVKMPRLHFRNINRYPYYYNPKELQRLQALREAEDWNALYHAMLAYVEKFGIENFKRDMDMVWHLARLAEHEEQWEVAKDVWRVIIKHHRGSADLSQRHHRPGQAKDWMDLQSKNLQEALHHYDSLTIMEKDLYVSLDYYYKLVEIRQAIDTLHPPNSVLLNMGETVNSNFEDYGMTIGGISDNMIYFTSNRHRDTTRVRQDLYGNDNEDIYFAEKDSEGIWGQAEPFEGINTRYKEGSPCMNKAGDMIIFARCFSPDGLGNCDLYQSVRLEGGAWSEPINLGPQVNSSLWDSHPSLSITEDTLYFSSDRPGGFGGADIYFSVKDRRGRWGQSQNLGPIINTQSSEVSPHIHPERNILYFSSNGHLVNFGDFDIFKSYHIGEDWSEPKNIGPLVNGKGSEIYFTIDSKAENLFYSKSHEHDIHNLDLYSFPLPMEAQPNAVVRFSGRLVEPVTGEVFTGVVTVIDLDHHIEVMPKHTYEDGTFEFDLIPERRYLLLIEGDNFFRIEEVVQMEDDGGSSLSEDSASAPLAKRVVTFESIDFDPNSAALKPSMENNLHLIIDFLVENPEYQCRVLGHTDSDGDPAANLALSKRRAEAIRDYLVNYGSLDPSRVQAVGFGSTQPLIAEERTESDKKRNRRVEFEIYKP
jgi:outer membrane protein OmpA-like peptidoglycan-associated protein